MQENKISGIRVIRFSVCLFFICTSFLDTVALTLSQNTGSETATVSQFGNLLKTGTATTHNTDTTIYYTRGANGLIIMPPSDWEQFPYNVSFRDTVIYNPAYLPVIFDGKILSDNIDFRKQGRPKSKKEFHLIPEEETLAPLIKKAKKIQEQRRSYYMNMGNISNVKYSSSTLKKIPKLDSEDVTKRNIFHNLIAAEKPIEIPQLELKKNAPEYIYWTKSGEHTLQVAQNYMTDNWSNGGVKNLMIRNYHKLFLNYVKDKINFENSLEWKLSLQQTPADSIHTFNITEDLIKMKNLFGYKAFNNWSYTFGLETQTQLLPGYAINDTTRKTSFLSPLVINISLGMSYTFEKKFDSDRAKKLKLSLTPSPFSLNYTYVRDDKVNATKYGGIKEGKKSKMDIGSLINADLAFNLNRYMVLTSRFKYFTSYKHVEVEFENKFDMLLNRYLSTTFYLYMKYNDSATKKEKNIGYFQLNELISFGLNYKW